VKFVVTGAAGFIGSHLAEALAAAGHSVVGVDCFTDYYSVAEKEANARDLEVLPLDLADVDLPLDGVDGVFHLAGQPGVRSFGDVFPTYVRRNILASQRVFAAAAAARVRVVFASTSSIYGNAAVYPTHEDTVPAPISPYGITKLACEHLAAAYERSFGLDAVVLRYFTVYGPRQRPDMFFRRVVDALASGGSFDVFGDGRQSRSFTYVADAVAATIRAMESAPGGAIFNVGGGEQASVREAISLLEEISGAELEVSYSPPAPGDVRRTSADTSRIRETIGWEASTSLREGLSEEWSWAVGRLSRR
jgi:nucleoside-diphosphate-sugar epimerase